jgi:hypothetical protein
MMSNFNMNSLGDLMAHSENKDPTSIGFEEQDAVAKEGNKIEAVEVVLCCIGKSTSPITTTNVNVVTPNEHLRLLLPAAQ